MYKILIVYLRVKLREMFKNRGVTAMIKQDVYKNVPQRAGWALSRSFLYGIYMIFLKKSVK
jgi:hypothetical protein